jgi:hypothetical protein
MIHGLNFSGLNLHAPIHEGYSFSAFNLSAQETNTEAEQHVQKLKAEVKMMLKAPVEKLSQKLDLIDDIQRLGVSRHFKNEIEEILQQIHKNSYVNCDDQENDDELNTVALRFRLLRQQGCSVSCSKSLIFSMFIFCFLSFDIRTFFL